PSTSAAEIYTLSLHDALPIYPPPGNLLAGATQEGAHRPGRPRETCFFGHLAVCDYFTGLQAPEHFEDGFVETPLQPVFLMPAAIPLTVRRIARCNNGSGVLVRRARARSDAWRWLIGSR